MSKHTEGKHKEAINQFLKYINGAVSARTDFVLRGGTALMTCYGLDRFSEDIDFDATNKELISLLDSFCVETGFTYRVAKDTDTVKRVFLNYGIENRPLKIEASYRKNIIDENDVNLVDGIAVYEINSLALQKTLAYAGRDKIRDLYDLTFVFKNYPAQLDKDTTAAIREVFSFKGLEHFDYLVNTQSDELINNEKLASDFLDVYNGLGLISNSDEVELIVKDVNQSSDEGKKSNVTFDIDKSVRDVRGEAYVKAGKEKSKTDDYER